MTTQTQLQQDVLLELAEMKKIGMKVPAKAVQRAEQNPEELEEYREGGMSISGIADLCIDLAF